MRLVKNVVNITEYYTYNVILILTQNNNTSNPCEVTVYHAI